MCILKWARVSVIFCGRWEFWAQIISQHYPPVCGPACNFLQCIDVTFTSEDNSGLRGTFKPFIAELWMYTLNSERALYLHIYWPADYITLSLYMFVSTKLACYSVASLIQFAASLVSRCALFPAQTFRLLCFSFTKVSTVCFPLLMLCYKLSLYK